MGREDREGPPPVQVGEGGSLVPTSHSKVVATAHPGNSHVPGIHLEYTSICTWLGGGHSG